MFRSKFGTCACHRAKIKDHKSCMTLLVLSIIQREDRHPFWTLYVPCVKERERKREKENGVATKCFHSGFV
ncbi:hypothetical protein PUN28_008484 [Cardiocondyla obscurior]|uniref:Uncharacterized protein n=1 Tax=Cardiocondyla obscurior TaxID=286306 RepID=A0AAW2G116_9HYME